MRSPSMSPQRSGESQMSYADSETRVSHLRLQAGQMGAGSGVTAGRCSFLEKQTDEAGRGAVGGASERSHRAGRGET